MKLNPLVTELALYDIRGGPGTFILNSNANLGRSSASDRLGFFNGTKTAG
jgi:hypothetical protein